MGLILGGILGRLAALARLVPWWAWALSAALLWGLWQRHRALSEAEALSALQASVAAATQKALTESLDESSRRVAAQQEALNAASKRIAMAQGSAARSAAAVAGLRHDLAAYAGAVPGDSFAALAGKANHLSDLVGECADRYRALAAITDDAVIRGQLCEQSYGDLTK